ncbi:TetR/AcrR family transcriptional regulator [Nocardioides gilvus]|uniref:TetR/AcrR family transcriptional regulator n=1 Tax=Nocardioides gilvus TaxID=1735589 RepID=UPI001EF6531D|nr:TetR/AcrR family transcriptional regulator [Nocardioides gilvus]
MTEKRRSLPLLGEPPVERRDAARNRIAILEATRRLIDRDGIDAVTMEAVATEANVGKGTVFRRFESRQGLMAALLDHSEMAWQGAVLFGPPPLGPDGDPLERLLAFGPSRLETTLSNLDLIRHATAGRGGRSRPPYVFAVMHVRHLLQEIGVRGDLPLLATAIMAPFEVHILEQQTRVDGVTTARINAGWTDLVRRIVRD